MASRGKAAAGKGAQKVRDAEAKFYDAHKALIEWEDSHEELMEEFRELVDARETAREELELAVSDTGLPGGGMKVVSTHRRTFDGERLHYLIEDDALRAEVVELVYKVKPKSFDRAVKEGRLERDVADQCITATETGIQIRKRPKQIVLG